MKHNVKNKKISILLPNLGGGGAEKNYSMLANFWVKKGYKIEFVLLKKEGIFIKTLDKSISFYNLNVSKYRYVFFPLLKYLFFNKSDLIIVNLWPLTFFTLLINFFLLNKNKIIVHDHQILSKSYSKEFNNYRSYLSISIKLTYKFSKGIIAVSNSVKNDLIKLGVKKNIIKVINNPIEIKSKKNITKNQSTILWGANSNFKILSIGSLKYEKDFISIISSISKIQNNNDIKLLIIGEGNEESNIKKHIQNLNLQKNVMLIGFKENLDDYYSSADLFISSSIHEGFGNVVADALCYGINIIATDSGGPNDILANGYYGDICKVKDVKMLAHLIEKNRKNKLTRNQIEKNIKRANDFRIEKISNDYIGYINEKI